MSKKPKPCGTVTIRGDAQTLDAIDKLVKACPPGTVHPKSSAIRRAIIESAARLEKSV